MITKRLLLIILLITFILTLGKDSPAQEAGQPSQEVIQLHKKAMDFLRNKKYEESIAVYKDILQRNTNDEIALYNSACAYSLWGKSKEAVEYLEKAVEAGFIDFDHIEADTDLKNIRFHGGYQKLIQQKDKFLKEGAEQKCEQLKKEFGKGYLYEVDDKRKWIYASDTSKKLLEKIKKFLEGYADAQRNSLFTNKPTYYIAILIPNKEDFRKRVPDPRIGGFYQPATKFLICKDTGMTLRHEFTHALHFADASARKQPEPPVWIGEGLATCFENSRIANNKLVTIYNDRISQTKSILNTPQYIRWETLMKTNHQVFMQKAGVCYAEVRAIFYWLNKTEKLKAFYDLYMKTFNDDVSGITAMEKLFNKKIDEIEKIWKEWITKTEPIKLLEDKKGTFLGVGVEDSVAGMIITSIVTGSAAEQGGLQVEDVILKIDNDKITTNDEFINAIRKRKPGEILTFYVLREEDELSIKVRLGKREDVYLAFSGNWSNIGCRSAHTFGLMSNGTIWGWGRNNYGQLGLGDALKRNTPLLIGKLPEWLGVAAGTNHSIGLKINGTLWAWGANDFGQLGLGNSGIATLRMFPSQVGTESNWLNISTGISHTLATKTNRTLWAWGQNKYGQLGLGYTNTRMTPTLIGNDSDWLKITCGDNHNLAIKTNGTLWAWGKNNYGQLGDNTTTNRTTPKPIGTDSDWSIIAVGANHTIACKTNGTIWAWGYNAYGQLGDGMTSNKTTPRAIGIQSDWSLVTAGDYHTIALKTDKTLWVWGANDFGQLGLGHIYNKNTPTQVGTQTDWSIIAAGEGYTIALKNNKTFWVWGNNEDGQLGVGDTTNIKIPSLLEK